MGLVAHYCPGFGDPFNMTVPQLNAILERLPRLIRMMNGAPMSDREVVDQAMREKV